MAIGLWTRGARRAGAGLAIAALALTGGLGAAAAAPAYILATAPLTSASFASPPVAVGGNHTCVLPGDGSVLCWGSDTVGELGDGRITDPAAPAGDVLALQTVIASRASGAGKTCTDLAPDGSVVRCHGADALGGAIAIAAGAAHTCALLADTTVECWGDNAVVDGGMFGVPSKGGQLGDGTTASRPYPAHVVAGTGQSSPLSGVTAITAAWNYTCALMTDATARCWGDGPAGASTAPVTILADATQPLAGITALAAGDFATCAQLTGGAVDCWGSNVDGLLGDGGSENASATPVQVMGAGAPPVPMSGVSGLVMGHDFPVGMNGVRSGHACVVDSSVFTGGVHCWGVGDSGQLGQSSGGSWAVIAGVAPLEGAVALAAGATFSCALMADGSVSCWGGGFGTSSSDGMGSAAPVAVLPASRPAVSIAAGGGLCAVFADGGLSCLDFFGASGMTTVPGISISAPTAAPAAVDPSLLGDWNVTYGAPTTLSVSYAAGVYTMTAKLPVKVAGATCSRPVGTVIATFSAAPDGKLSGQHGRWYTNNCTFAQWTSITLSLDASGQTLTADLGNGTTVAYTKAAPAVTPTPTPAAVPAGDADALVGDWSVIYGAPVMVAMSFASGTYTVTTTEPTPIFGANCSVPAGTVMEIFTGSSGTYTGTQNLFSVDSCALGSSAALTGTRDAAGRITIHYSGNPGTHILVPALPAAPAEGVVGSWQAGHDVVSYASGIYSVTQAIPSNNGCPVAAGSITAIFSGSGGSYSGAVTGWVLPACTPVSLPLSLSLSGDTLTLTHSASGGIEVWTRVSAPAAVPSAFRTSIPTIGQLNLTPEVVVPAIALTIGVIFLVPFPSALFNSTVRANYAEIMRRARRMRRRLRNALLAPWFALRGAMHLSFGPVLLPLDVPELAPNPNAPLEERHDFWWTLPGVALFVVATAILAGFLDPAFGPNPDSITTFVGILVGLVLVLAAFDLPLILIYRRAGMTFALRALPATALVSVACVLLSRLTDFHPGYLYGLIIALVASRKLAPLEEGKDMAVGVAATMVAALLAWLALGVVSPLVTSPDPGPALIVTQTMLSAMVAAGVQIASFGLLPMSFLLGESVMRWNRWVWMGMTTVGWLAFLVVILNPRNGYLSDTTRTPLFTIIALLAFFSLFSYLFWRYFRRHPMVEATTGV